MVSHRDDSLRITGNSAHPSVQMSSFTVCLTLSDICLLTPQAENKGSPSAQEVDEQEVLLSMIRDFLSRSPGDKVESLRYQLHNILDEPTQQDGAEETEGKVKLSIV